MSDLQTQILEILQDGDFHSGESLGKQLGVSRTAIWKRLQKLASMGMQLESVKGRGYRAPTGFKLLVESQIVRHLTAESKRQLRQLQIAQSLESTNTAARENSQQQQLKGISSTGSVILAESQTSGRGRRGKHWVSPFASNIYLSIVWDFERGAAALEGLSLAIGVAVHRALSELGIQGVQLKWPNDIYINNKKVGGILLEMIGDPVGHCSVIVGIGINVAMSAECAGSIDQAWTDLTTESTIEIGRNKLVALLINHSFALLTDYQHKGFVAYRREWQAVDAFSGRRASIATAKQTISGTLMGVDSSGALQLRLQNGQVKSFIGGELSVWPIK